MYVSRQAEPCALSTPRHRIAHPTLDRKLGALEKRRMPADHFTVPWVLAAEPSSGGLLIVEWFPPQQHNTTCRIGEATRQHARLSSEEPCRTSFFDHIKISRESHGLLEPGLVTYFLKTTMRAYQHMHCTALYTHASTLGRTTLGSEAHSGNCASGTAALATAASPTQTAG